MSTTIKEARLKAGLSREELAERIGVTEHLIEVWEERGFSEEPGSRFGDFLAGKAMQALEVEDGLILDYVPSDPRPGDLIIRPGAGIDVGDLLQHAEETEVRITVPDRFGQHLVLLKELSEEDQAALHEHFDRERRYSESVVRRMENTLEMLGGRSGEWGPNKTMGERLEEVDRELSDELERGE